MEVYEGKGGISAKVVTDSLSPSGVRLTTLELNYHRFIHSEMMTHRMFSRNASSSRAIPIEKMLQQVRDNPATPIHWGKNQPGMQAREELTQEDLEEATERCFIAHEKAGDKYADFPNWWYAFTESHEGFDEFGGGSFQKDPLSIQEVLYQEWVGMAREAAKSAEELNQLGLHKQIVNRVLEPFQWIKVIVTATEWDNFFKLRLHKDAQPEIQELARCMRKAMWDSTPTLLHPGEWHLPYVKNEGTLSMSCYANKQDLLTDMIKCSVARCARVSYLNHDKTSPDIGKDIALADMLLEAGHMSPFEHQATPMSWDSEGYVTDGVIRVWQGGGGWDKGTTHMDISGNLWSGNFKSWIQNRQWK